MPSPPEPIGQTIAVSLVQGESLDRYPHGVPAEHVDEWYRLTWDLGLWFRERGYRVAVTGFSVAMNGRNATLNVTPP